MTRPRTELRNPRAGSLSSLTTRDLLALMNDEDAGVPAAVRHALPAIERAVDLCVIALRAGGSLLYAGAGTSGRLGVLDASEMPPTFGVDPRLVRGLIAGGDAALRTAVEGAEDDAGAGERDLRREATTKNDVVVGISASGRARYVVAALAAARATGARTIALTCVDRTALTEGADVAIIVDVGPEVLAGSSRLKAGTATKLVLNMISTATMVGLGRTKDDLMIDMRATNAKLRERAIAMVSTEAGVDAPEATRRLEAAGWSVREALDRQR